MAGVSGGLAARQPFMPSMVTQTMSGKAGDPAWEAQKAAQSRANAQMTYGSFAPGDQATHEVREVSPGFWGAVAKNGGADSGAGQAGAGTMGGGISYGGGGGGDMGGPPLADMKSTGTDSPSMQALAQAMGGNRDTPMLASDMGGDSSSILGKRTPPNKSGALAALAGIIY